MGSRETGGKKHRAAAVSAITNILNQGSVSTNQQKNDSESDYIPIFFQEISDIMRGYGDAERPIRESVILVEKIIIQQMRSILNDLLELAIQRKGSPAPTQRDVEFLMRKNPVKVYRLQKHLKDLEFRRRYQDMLSGRPTVYYEEFDDDNSDDDNDREVPERFDEEKIRRVFRADRVSLLLSGPQYAQYNEARRTSFHSRNSTIIRTKLKTILSPPSDVYISPHVYTIFGFLVHETIATIVDLAILTRLNASNQAVDPFDRVTSSGWHIKCSFPFSANTLKMCFCFVFTGASFSMLHVCPEVTQGRGRDGCKAITVQEIQEAIRRHTSGYTRTKGMYRNTDRPHTIPYLAI